MLCVRLGFLTHDYVNEKGDKASLSLGPFNQSSSINGRRVECSFKNSFSIKGCLNFVIHAQLSQDELMVRKRLCLEVIKEENQPS